MVLPKFVKVKQVFSAKKINNIEDHLKKELKDSLPTVRSGDRIAITVGSRGIKNRITIVKTLVNYLKEKGASPFLIGAMGSHGGGTQEGQMDVLNSLGFTEEAIGCSILTSDEVINIGKTTNGLNIYCDKYAWEADGIIVMNRVKLHTAFHGPNESGLLKMITVGLGKTFGANQFHRQGPEQMSESVREIGTEFIERGNVIAGVGIVENSFDETAHLEVIRPEQIQTREKELLLLAKSYFPRLPVENLDILVIGMMGKNYSGTGMDTNVIGRNKIFGVPEPDVPAIKRIVVLDLDPASHGNATGIGLADITTEKLVKKFDRQKTYHNCLTSTYVQRAMIPMITESEYHAISTAVKSLGIDDVNQLRIAIIKNTQDLEELFLTENVIAESNTKLIPLSSLTALTFDQQRDLEQIEWLGG